MVGQNNGAGRLDRAVQSYRTSLLFGFLIMVGVLTPVLLFARTIMRQFTESREVIAVGTSYLYIEALTFYSYVAIQQSASVLQGLKRPAMILWASLYRQIPAPLVVFTLFTGPLAMGVRGIWWGLAVVNWSAALFLFWYTARQLRRSFAGMAGESPAV
jgi:Na+-driven multidrug efflux pump